MFEQIFAFLLVVFFHMWQFHSDFYCLFHFWIGLFLNGFPNSFINHSRPSFLFEPKFSFSLVFFCSHAAL